MDALQADIAREGLLVFFFGLVAQGIFQTRFYIQWLASERQKKSIVPISFWYLSSVGTLMLLTFAAITHSAVGALSNGLNIVIYARNLVHIWRNQGRLSKRMHTFIHVAVGVIAVIAVYVVIQVWLFKYHETETVSPSEARRTWFWLAIGASGTLLFGSRFIIQWIATERARASVIPTAFWYLSIGATVMQLASYVQTQEWIFALGSVTAVIIYARNLWFVHQAGGETTAAGAD